MGFDVAHKLALSDAWFFFKGCEMKKLLNAFVCSALLTSLCGAANAALITYSISADTYSSWQSHYAWHKEEFGPTVYSADNFGASDWTTGQMTFQINTTNYHDGDYSEGSVLATSVPGISIGSSSSTATSPRMTMQLQTFGNVLTAVSAETAAYRQETWGQFDFYDYLTAESGGEVRDSSGQVVGWRRKLQYNYFGFLRGNVVLAILDGMEVPVSLSVPADPADWDNVLMMQYYEEEFIHYCYDESGHRSHCYTDYVKDVASWRLGSEMDISVSIQNSNVIYEPNSLLLTILAMGLVPLMGGFYRRKVTGICN